MNRRNVWARLNQDNIYKGHLIFWDDASHDEVIRLAWRMCHDLSYEDFGKRDARELTEAAQKRRAELHSDEGGDCFWDALDSGWLD